MIDVGMMIEPKSDQLNADDMIAGPIVVRIRDISANQDAAQPISLFYDGDNNKPYKPCLSMRRVLVNIWGRDGNKYVGKSLKLFRDPTVKFGGFETGGIRISEASDIEKPVIMALTATRGSRKPYTVKPLSASRKEEKPELDESAILIHAKAEAEQGTVAFKAHYKTLSPDERAVLQSRMDDLKAECEKADNPPDHLPGDDGDVFND